MLSFVQWGYLMSRLAGFQLGEAGEMFQVSFGGNIKVLFLVAVGIKDGGGRKGGVEVAEEEGCFCATQDGGTQKQGTAAL